MKKKVFRILDFERKAQAKRGQAEIAHMNRIRRMERECDRMHEERGKNRAPGMSWAASARTCFCFCSFGLFPRLPAVLTAGRSELGIVRPC